jgi:heme-degrading monooxygenase HmoA
MNVFMTTGTYGYLLKVKEKHEGEAMVLMMDEDTALLLHETSGETVFKEPRRYEVVDGAGTYEKARFVVMNNIPVAEEGRPLFEHSFKNRDRSIDQMPGFVGIRILRPLSSDTYVILTLWKDESDFERWKQSDSFSKSHQKAAFGSEAAHPPKKIFAGASYVKKYYIPEGD